MIQVQYPPVRTSGRQVFWGKVFLFSSRSLPRGGFVHSCEASSRERQQLRIASPDSVSTAASTARTKLHRASASSTRARIYFDRDVDRVVIARRSKFTERAPLISRSRGGPHSFR